MIPLLLLRNVPDCHDGMQNSMGPEYRMTRRMDGPAAAHGAIKAAGLSPNLQASSL